MSKRIKTGSRLYVTGYSVLIVSTLVYILSEQHYTTYVFAAGAVCTIVGRYMTLPRTDDFRIRRLNNLLAISAILILVTAYLMYLNQNIWAITLTIAAFIDLFTTFRYPKVDNRK